MSRPLKGPRLVRINGKENWYVRDGRGKQFTTGTADRESAECTLALYIAKKAMPEAPNVSQLLDIRLDDLKARGASRARDNKYLHKILKAHFGRLKPEQISTPLISKFRLEYSNSNSMQRELLLELKMTFNMAVKDGIIDKAPNIKAPAPNPPRERFLTQEEAAQLLAAVKAPHLRLFIHLALVTGARKGALLGLTWDRVDMEAGRLDFNDPEMRLSNKRRTTAPITQETIEMLRKAKKFSETDYVIEYYGKRLLDIKKSFNNAVKKAGLKKVTPHVLKHTAISWLAQHGHSVDKISELTATHPNTVRRIYRKFAPEYLQDEANCLASIMSSANTFAKQAANEQEQETCS